MDGVIELSVPAPGQPVDLRAARGRLDGQVTGPGVLADFLAPYVAGVGWLAVIGGTTLPGMTGTLLPILRVLRVPAIEAVVLNE
jgi:hypothetical protein